jgi:hypothetical protein
MPEGTAAYALHGNSAVPPCSVAVGDSWGCSDGNDEVTIGAALRRSSESFCDSVLDLYAASKVFCIQLITFEALFVMLFSVITTTLYYFLGKSSSGPSFGANISWTIVSFAVVSPMIMQIRQAFTRREQALDIIAECESACIVLRLKASGA